MLLSDYIYVRAVWLDGCYYCVVDQNPIAEGYTGRSHLGYGSHPAKKLSGGGHSCLDPGGCPYLSRLICAAPGLILAGDGLNSSSPFPSHVTCLMSEENSAT